MVLFGIRKARWLMGRLPYGEASLTPLIGSYRGDPVRNPFGRFSVIEHSWHFGSFR